MESRITLLERKINRFLSAPDELIEVSTESIQFSCDDPGILVARMYPSERDQEGTEYCWIGNDGPIQIVLPVRPSRASACVLKLMPHPEVDFRSLTVQVNDQSLTAQVSQSASRRMDVSFPVPASAAASVSILLLGLTSVRPSDFGENSDHRLLAARFFGATVTFA